MPLEPDLGENLADTIGEKAARRLRARSRPERSVWFGLGMFGLVGWAVTVPTVLSIALGIWIDRRWSGSISWTLTLLFVGVMLGCVNAWYWVQREGHDRHGEG
jgi:ATP synthase protein I